MEVLSFRSQYLRRPISSTFLMNSEAINFVQLALFFGLGKHKIFLKALSDIRKPFL